MPPKPPPRRKPAASPRRPQAKKVPAARTEPPAAVAARGFEASPRHLEVLREALVLFGERGYGGASLRELARRLGIAQPSLYHWFDSKEQLVEQIILYLGGSLLGVRAVGPLPRRLVDVPRFVADSVFEVWRGPAYPHFVRFLFVIAMEQPQFGTRVKALYAGGLAAGVQVLCGPFIATGEITEEEALHLGRLVANGLGLALIEEILLYGERAPSRTLRAFADGAVKLVEEGLAARGRKRR